jgi:cytochrome c551
LSASARPPRRLPRRALAVLLPVAAALVLAASCGSSAPSPAAPLDDPQLVEGRSVYAAECARCHGPTGSGGAGPRLAGRQIDLDVVRDGRRGMPAFGEKLDAEEIDAVAAYIAEVL